MKEGANLIFRDKLIINGTKKHPVEIKPMIQKFGTIALQGKKTSSSFLKMFQLVEVVVTSQRITNIQGCCQFMTLLKSF